MIQAGILLTVLCSIPLGQSTDLIATTAWTQAKRDTWIDLKSKPFNLQVEVTNVDSGKTIKILLEEGADTVTMDLNVEENTFKTTDCNDFEAMGSPLAIKNGGTGIWSFKVNSEKMEIYQNGNLWSSYDESCLMDSIFTKIKFTDADKISNRFRLQPEPCTAYPSTWQHVKFPGETPSGDLVTVACTDSRVNKGSEEVTCKTGQQWTSDVTPECVYQCTGIDEGIYPNMFIPALPAYEGDVLTVQCYRDTVQLGSEIVTCYKDQRFNSNIGPECRKLGTKMSTKK